MPERVGVWLHGLPKRTDALAFGRGPLPEGQALASMAKDARVTVNATFALLSR
jgi:hypothetical protein